MTGPRTQAGRDHVAAWIDVADMTEAVLAIEAEALPSKERLSEAIWNALSSLPWAEHEPDDCEVCDTHRAIIREDAARILSAMRAARRREPEPTEVERRARTLARWVDRS